MKTNPRIAHHAREVDLDGYNPNEWVTPPPKGFTGGKYEAPHPDQPELPLGLPSAHESRVAHFQRGILGRDPHRAKALAETMAKSSLPSTVSRHYNYISVSTPQSLGAAGEYTTEKADSQPGASGGLRHITIRPTEVHTPDTILHEVGHAVTADEIPTMSRAQSEGVADGFAKHHKADYDDSGYDGEFWEKGPQQHTEYKQASRVAESTGLTSKVPSKAGVQDEAVAQIRQRPLWYEDPPQQFRSSQFHSV